MLLSIAPSPAAVTAASQLSASVPAPASARVPFAKGSTVACRAAGKGKKEEVLVSGVTFQPFEELKGELSLVPQADDGQSLARQKFVGESEAALNKQINVEYNASYAYHSLYAYFDRDNVALKGFAKFFKESSDEERGHAEKLMEYQTWREGEAPVHRHPIDGVRPLRERRCSVRNGAGFPLSVDLNGFEKLVNEKLHNLHTVATRCNDPQLSDFVESQFLQEQVVAVKKISEYVTQLRRIGKGHGVWHFDRMLLEA